MKAIIPAFLCLISLTAAASEPQEPELPFKLMDSLILNGHPITVWDVMDTIPLPEVQTRLTEKDYEEVAKELGADVAAIKAVVEIEAGKSHNGFWSEDHPVINFDLSMYRQAAKRFGVDLKKARKKSPVIFNKPDTRKYGSQQAAQQARLDAAMAINKDAAIEGTFWGMFQIGGFNWKKCGTSSREEFVELMSRSERDQLELFAHFLQNTGLDKYLKSKNWSAFARGYNGASYARRGYHTRLAKAYKNYSRK